MSRSAIVGSLVVLCSVTVAGCDSPSSPAETLPLTRVTQGYFGAPNPSQRLVVRSQQDFAAAWAAIFTTSSPQPPAPSVDFTQEMVIIALSGSKPSGGYCIAVEHAAGDRRSATVTVRSVGPTAGNPILPVITNPYDIVRVPRRDRVSFTEVSEIGNCGPLT
jgi:hypothetical protein